MYVDLRLNDNHIESGYTPVTFSGLQTGAKYLVVVYWYGDYYFRHFSNGNLQRYAYVTLNTTAGQNTYSMNALYESVPTSQAASLNIIAQFPNGTQIGTASEIDGYPQHTPRDVSHGHPARVAPLRSQRPSREGASCRSSSSTMRPTPSDVHRVQQHHLRILEGQREHQSDALGHTEWQRDPDRSLHAGLIPGGQRPKRRPTRGSCAVARWAPPPSLSLF